MALIQALDLNHKKTGRHTAHSHQPPLRNNSMQW